MPCPLLNVAQIAKTRITLPKNLMAHEARISAMLLVQEVLNRFPEGVPLVDPEADMGVVDASLAATRKKLTEVRAKLAAHPMAKCGDTSAPADSTAEAKKQLMVARQMEGYEQKAKIDAKIQELVTEKLNGSMARKFRIEVKNRCKVLRKLDMLSQDTQEVLLKGKAACEIDTADELLTTELMFHNAFNQLSVPQFVAVVSCLIPCEKSQDMVTQKDKVARPLAMLQELARNIATVQAENGVEINVEDYVDSFKPTLMDLVYKWVSGSSFADLAESTDLFEGSVIRAFRRLNELLAQMALAAQVIGNPDLEQKATKGAEALQRGIVFAASLYL